MKERRKVVRQRLTRQQKVEQAIEETQKTPFVNRWGMTPAKIREAFNSSQSKTEIREKKQGIKSKETRPQKAFRKNKSDNKLRLLLESPAVSIQTATQYPTPSWMTTKDKADVSVIVPIYKSASVVKDLIKSWDFSNDGLKVELIFVDDCCPMDSKTAIVQHLNKIKGSVPEPFCRIFYNTVNQGFGVTCNTGAYHATGDYLIFLNSDTVLTKSWIKPMIRLLKKPEVGIVGNLQIKRGGQWDDYIDGAGSEWHWEDTTFHHIGRHTYRGHKISSPFHPSNCPDDVLSGVQEREMVTGCCIAIKSDLFKEIGGFNPNYRIGYWEDSDLCLTVKEKGLKILFTPFSKIYHKLGHSGSGEHKYQDHNKNYFMNKWVTTGRIDPLVKAKRIVPAPELKKILVRRWTANGDALVASAVVAGLKKKHKGCQVYFNSHHPSILEDNPHIDGFVTDQETAERRFEVYYNLDMAYEQRPYTNILKAYADAVGVKTTDCEFFLKTEPIENLPPDYVVIHSGAYTNWVGREWSATKFEIVASRLAKMGHNIVCVGHGRDNNITSHVNLINKTNIHQLAYVIENAKLFVGIDSLPMHIAQVFDTPGVCFFGSINPQTRIYRDSMQAVSAELPCLGCHHRKPAPCTVTTICETRNVDCTNNVSVNQMMNAIEGKL